MLLRDGDHEVRLAAVVNGYQESWRQAVEAIGRNVMQAVFDGHRDMFSGLALTDPCETTVYEDEDSSLGWCLSISGGRISVLPDE
jgi:hypothetical protein